VFGRRFREGFLPSPSLLGKRGAVQGIVIKVMNALTIGCQMRRGDVRVSASFLLIVSGGENDAGSGGGGGAGVAGFGRDVFMREGLPSLFC